MIALIILLLIATLYFGIFNVYLIHKLYQVEMINLDYKHKLYSILFPTIRDNEKLDNLANEYAKLYWTNPHFATEFEECVRDFKAGYQAFIENNKPMPPEFSKVVDEHFWELIGDNKNETT